MSRVEDDLRVNTLEVLTSASIPGLSSFSPATFGLSLVNKTLITVHQTVTTTGSNQTIYTCPSNRRAMYLNVIYSNNSGVTASVNNVITVGGATVSYTAVSVATPGVSIQAGNLVAPIFEAGDVFAINTTQQPMGVVASFIEFDATSNLKSGKKVGSWSIGDNTIYTVPGGKTAIVMVGTVLGINGYSGIAYANGSGATRTTKWNLVPSGGSPSNGNLLHTSTGTTNGVAGSGVNNGNSTFFMAAGDFLSINTDSALDTQIGFATVMEI